MKLLLEGSANEVRQFMATGDGFVDEISPEVERVMDEVERFCGSKGVYMKVAEMTPYHLVNSIKKAFSDNYGWKAEDFLSNEVFQSMILNLAEAIEETIEDNE